MQLYSGPNSTFSRRVRVALFEKGLEAQIVDVSPAERRAPEYLALNPCGRIPTLVDGNLVLFESTAILGYLEERWPEPALLPPDPTGRALAAMWVKLCDVDFTPHAVALQRPKRLEPEADWDRDAMAAASRALEPHLALLERRLTDRAYLVGDRFTQADLVYLPFLHFRGLLDVPVGPALEAWSERLAERPSARATEPRQ